MFMHSKLVISRG